MAPVGTSRRPLARRFCAALALAPRGLLALPSYKTSYNDRNYLPADIPANEGYAAADPPFLAGR